VGRIGNYQTVRDSNCLARKLSNDPTKTGPLEEFWDRNQVHDDDEHHESAVHLESPSADKAKRRRSQHSPNDQVRTRKRAVTAASALVQSLSPHHPALSLPNFLDTFGPLVFPLYKAALLRKRILLVGSAPVELACNFGKQSERGQILQVLRKLNNQQCTIFPFSRDFLRPFRIFYLSNPFPLDFVPFSPWEFMTCQPSPKGLEISLRIPTSLMMAWVTAG